MSEILFADDDAAMRAMVGDVLRAAGHDVRLAPDGRERARARSAAARPTWSSSTTAWARPDGLEICRALTSDPQLEHLPVLILTGEAGVEHRVQGLRRRRERLPGEALRRRASCWRAVRALLRLSAQGLRDRNPTSGLPGGEAIERELQRRRVAREPRFAVCYLDLDHFKPFSDRFGFAAADRVIRARPPRSSAAPRASTTPSRATSAATTSS